MSEFLTKVETVSTDSGEIRLSPDIIKQYICEEATDTEALMFLRLCQHQKLNPFLKEAYLIKYGSSPAQMVVSYQVFLSRAESNDDYDGYESEMELDKDKMPLSCTVKVYKKSRSRPIIKTIYFEEFYAGNKNKDGSVKKRYDKNKREYYDMKPTVWDEKPRFMLEKVALASAFRLAFPKAMQGLYTPEEMEASNMVNDSSIIDHEDTINESECFEVHQIYDNLSDEAKESFLSFMKIDNPDNILKKDYGKAINLLKQKAK